LNPKPLLGSEDSIVARNIRSDEHTEWYTWDYAMRAIRDYHFGEYSDWRLPNKDELHEMYKHREVIGGFASAHYWSSSEYRSFYAWLQNFSGGDQAKSSKSNNNRVRPVRAF
jgi:hypothetical protein